MYRTNISVNSQRWHLSQEIALNSSLKFLKLHFPRRGAIIALIAFLFPAPGPLPAPLLPPAKSNLNEGLSHNYIAIFSLLFFLFSEDILRNSLSPERFVWTEADGRLAITIQCKWGNFGILSAAQFL